MNPLADTISSEISAPNGRDLQKRLLQAMFLMERYRGIDAGWADELEVPAADISPEAIVRLAQALGYFIGHYPSHPDVGSAVWALGKLRDPQYINLLKTVAKVGSGYSEWAREQALRALEDQDSEYKK